MPSYFDQTPWAPQISGLLGAGYQGIMPGDQYIPGPVNIPQPTQPQHPGFFGKGGGWATALGILGDGLAGAGGGQPLYAKSLMDQKQHERDLAEAEQKRQQSIDDQWALYQRKAAFDAANPGMPSAAQDAQWYRTHGQPDRAADVEAKAQLVPVQVADPVTGEVRYQYVHPTELIGGGGQGGQGGQQGLPHVSSPEEAAQLQPGSKFIGPDNLVHTVPGGAAPSNGPGGFQF